MAIVIKDGERLYLRAWEYNAARIITRLATIVTDNGGKVKPTHNAVISDRGITGKTIEMEERLTAVKAAQEDNPTDIRAAYIANMEKELERCMTINNAPITVTHTGYITFILENTRVYFQTDDNPFFPFHYSKTTINNGKYSCDACLDEDKKEWLFDCFFKSGCPDEDITEAAYLIYNMLINAKNTPIIRDKTRKRVYNLYDGGYHYETIYSPERFSKIDF